MRAFKFGGFVATVVLATAGAADADTTYTFNWDHAETTFFQFASNDWLAESNPPDSWTADVDTTNAPDFDITFFDDANDFFHATPYTVNDSMNVPRAVSAKFVIEDVVGSFNTSTETATWTIHGHVRFIAANGTISEGSCRTSSFDVDFDGDYNSGTDSDPFVISTLSGSGSQSCSGHATDLNNDFALGGSGALIHFNKFHIAPL